MHLRCISSGWKGFCEYLEEHYKDKELNLYQTNLGNCCFEDIQYLSQAIMKNKSITTLSLTDNCLGEWKLGKLKNFVSWVEKK